ncbi:transglutaminase domain-containing protein [Pseudooceanicola sp.]|uniref:transglutaminase family protein n=1 Tax=Pseudooceanicola sp. TaxID=1914328 RepID=UPI0035C71442
MRLKISHTTQYRFSEPVHSGLQQLRMTPLDQANQKIIDWNISVEGGVKQLDFMDHFTNHVDLIALDSMTTQVTISCNGTVEVEDTHGVLGRHTGCTPLWLYRRAADRTAIGPGIRRLARQVEGDRELDQMHHLMALVGEAVTYATGSSEPHWTAEEALAEGKGVCQDHAHIFLACARELKLPARYVSGYLMMDDRTEQEAMHAWAEVHVSDLGWVGFDVSNGISPDARYVRVATGLDYSDAAPVIGTRLGGTDEDLNVEIEVAQQQ